MSPTILLRLFGPPSISVDCHEARLQRKPLALLAYLAVTGERVSRVALAELLWPESSARQAGVNLRKSLWSLQKTLGEPALQFLAGSSLQIGDAVLSDVCRFEQLREIVAGHGHAPGEVCSACLEPLVEATGLYRGDLLSGFSLSDSSDFDAWQILQSERSRRLAANMLDRLAALYRATGAWNDALDCAERRLALDPLHEGAQRQLIALYGWTGRRTQALRQYADCVRQLERELGVEPEPETTALLESIEAGRLPPPTDRLFPGPETGSAGRRRSLEAHVSVLERIDISAGEGASPAAGALSKPARRDRSDVGVDTSVSAASLLATVLDPSATIQLGLADARSIAGQSPLDFTAYRLGRIAAWARPEYRLDERFVALTLLSDRGESVNGERWVERSRSYADLGAILADAPEPAFVLLGRPGSGKSTLLRRLEMDLALAGLRDGDLRVSFFVSLAGYRSEPPASPPPDPYAWLAAQWRGRYPRLPAFETIFAAGRMLLLLDGLNEMPHAGMDDYHDRVGRWKAFLLDRVRNQPGIRVVFACRGLDYSAPLSSPALPVPQARVEPLSDAQVRAFLEAYRPDRAAEIWDRLAGTERLELFRVPYLLRLLLGDPDAGAEALADPAAVFTRMLRQALRREVERGSADYRPGALLTERDCRRVVQSAWRSPYELPAHGVLMPGLERLAFRMQDRHRSSQGAQVRLGYDDAVELLDLPEADRVLRAGLALNVLDEDLSADALGFSHQLLQEYFAARRLAREPDPRRVYSPWSDADVDPSLRQLLLEPAGSEGLPALPTTGWEEATAMAALMCDEPAAFVAGLMSTNLPLAGRCARALGARCPADLRDDLRRQLFDRARNPAAELRSRIAAGLVLGRLGHPFFERRSGPHGDYLQPQLAEIPAGLYPIGGNGPLDYLGSSLEHHLPRHDLRLGSFSIGRFAVTNAEWSCFMAAGGYEDPRWWDTAAGRAWRSGEGTAAGHRAAVRYWWLRFRADPRIVEQQYESGEFDEQKYRLWRQRLRMDADALEAHLRELHPDQIIREPLFWRDEAFNNPAQPVVGICWFEARAYCRWLAAQTGLAFRLPTEVEWEAAARGAEGLPYAGAAGLSMQVGNTMHLRLRRTTPVGVFPDGDSPWGVADMVGNSWDWTASLWGPEVMSPAFGYPYDASDGREKAAAPSDVYRVVRGGAWFNGRVSVRSDYRGRDHALDRTSQHGLRVVVSDE